MDKLTFCMIFSSVGAHGGSGYRGFLSLLEAKNVTPEMFEDDVPAAACDYLGGVGAAAATSNIAGPAAAAFGHGSVDPYSTVAASSAPPVKHETAASLLLPLVYPGDDSAVHGSSMGCMPCYDHEEKPADDSQRQGFGAPTAAFLQQMVPRRVELQSALLGYSDSGMVPERPESSFGVGSLPDAGSFNRSSADFMPNNSNRQEQDIRTRVSFDFLTYSIVFLRQIEVASRSSTYDVHNRILLP